MQTNEKTQKALKIASRNTKSLI